MSGSPDLSGPVLYRILPLSNFGGKPCKIYESRATPSGITGNNDELCRSLMCLTIFHRREDLKLQIGHCQFLCDYHIELSRSESLTRYSGLVNIFKYLDN